jgi:hypothetical protein
MRSLGTASECWALKRARVDLGTEEQEMQERGGQEVPGMRRWARTSGTVSGRGTVWSIGEPRTTVHLTRLPAIFQGVDERSSTLLATCLLGGLLNYSSTLKMQAIHFSKTSGATQQITWHLIPDDTLHNHRCENLKSCNIKWILLVQILKLLIYISFYSILNLWNMRLIPCLFLIHCSYKAYHLTLWQ